MSTKIHYYYMVSQNIEFRGNLYFQLRFEDKDGSTLVLLGNTLYDKDYVEKPYKVEDMSTPANPNGKYKSFCNDNLDDDGNRRGSPTYQLSKCNYNPVRLTGYTFKKKLSDDELKQLVYRNPVVVMVNVSIIFFNGQMESSLVTCSCRV